MNRLSSFFALFLFSGYSVIVFAQAATATNGTKWDSLRDRFAAATPARFDDVIGIHAGRCFKYGSPNLPRDSALAIEMVPGSEVSGPLFPKPGAKAGDTFAPFELISGAEEGPATGMFDELAPWWEQAIARYFKWGVEHHRMTIVPTDTPQGLKIEYYVDSGSQAIVSARQIIVKRDREFVYATEFYVPNPEYRGDVPWTGLPTYCYYFKKLK